MHSPNLISVVRQCTDPTLVSSQWYVRDALCHRWLVRDPCDRMTCMFQGCLDCGCDPGGSYATPCDRITGQCACKPGMRGQYCNITDSNTYIPFLDTFALQPFQGGCTKTSDLISPLRPFTGRVFAICMMSNAVIFDTFQGANMKQPLVSWLV